jgi:RecB family exonuclease
LAELLLVTARDPRLLLQHAAEGFLDPAKFVGGPFPTPPYLLALRQGGVRDDLIAMACQARVPGWFDPPLCIFHELPDWLGRTAREPLDPLERQLLLGRLLREAGGEVFARLRRPASFIMAMDQWFGELCALEVRSDRYAEAAATLGGDAFEQRRNRELAALYAAYHAALARGGKDGRPRRDGRDTLADCARAIREGGAMLDERLGRHRREVRFFGLNDLRGGWPTLLAALRDSARLDRVVVYSSYLLPGLVERLGARHEALEEPPSVAARLFAQPPVKEGRVARVSAPDPERELEVIAMRVRQLHEQGVPLEQIAIVARRARPHVDLALRALAGAGLPATVRRRRGEREVPVIRAVLALFNAAAERWSRHGLVELASQPYFATGLDPVVLNYAGFRARLTGLADWRGALEELVARARRRDAGRGREGDDRRSPLPATARCAATLDAFERFSQEAARLDEPRSLPSWLAALSEFLDRDPFGLQAAMHAIASDEHQVIREDGQGWRRLRQVVDSWRRALDTWGDDARDHTVEEFSVLLREALDGDIALSSETAFGVQVLESLAAAYRPFRHVFLVGLEAGQFPSRAPASPLMDEADREALAQAGLPLDRRHDWDTRERELFRVLVAGASEGCTVSFARSVGGEETIPSAYLDALGEVAEVDLTIVPSSAVFLPGQRLAADAEAEAVALHAATIERARAAGEATPWSGILAAADLRAWAAAEFGEGRLWSPTQLEQYARCPWAFLASRVLRLERLEDPDDGIEPTVRGALLHDVLKRFYAALGASWDTPLLLRADDAPEALAALAPALDAAIAAAEARGAWLGPPALRATERAALLRLLEKYIAAEIEENEKYWNNRSPRSRQAKLGVAAHEVEIPEVLLERDGVRFRYRGVIDRVDRGVERPEFGAVVEYKSSKSATPGKGEKAAWTDGVVLQTPLYAHALPVLHPNATVTALEYRALKNGSAVHRVVLHERTKQRSLEAEDDEARAKLDGALASAAAHVRALRDGRFPPAPAPSCNCPPWCVAWAICRTPGGPKA